MLINSNEHTTAWEKYWYRLDVNLVIEFPKRAVYANMQSSQSYVESVDWIAKSFLPLPDNSKISISFASEPGTNLNGSRFIISVAGY